MFKEITSANVLTSIVEKEKDANTLTNIFMKRLNGMIHTCFRETRMKEDCTQTDIMKLFERRNILRSKTDENSKQELTNIENELADKCAESN